MAKLATNRGLTEKKLTNKFTFNPFCHIKECKYLFKVINKYAFEFNSEDTRMTSITFLYCLYSQLKNMKPISLLLLSIIFKI